MTERQIISESLIRIRSEPGRNRTQSGADSWYSSSTRQYVTRNNSSVERVGSVMPAGMGTLRGLTSEIILDPGPVTAVSRLEAHMLSTHGTSRVYLFAGQRVRLPQTGVGHVDSLQAKVLPIHYKDGILVAERPEVGVKRFGLGDRNGDIKWG